MFSPSSHLISNPYLCLPPLSSQASWRTWWSRCLQSGPASPTHGCPTPWWATWGWTRPTGGPCCGNRAPWRRGPARPAPTQKTAPLPEEAAPKKYLREAENPDTPREPLHLDPWPRGLQLHLILTFCFVAFASHLDKPLILFNLFNF